MTWADSPQLQKRWRLRQQMVDAVAALDIDEMYRLFGQGAVLDDVQRALADTERAPGEVLAAMDTWLACATAADATVSRMRIAVAQPPLDLEGAAL